ncbi:unnamed protein product [Alternaria alternata]|jgi:hypothetical protein
MPKEYLQAPNFELLPPPTGPLKLGHILDDPKEPRYPLNEDDVQPLAASETYTHTATGFSATRSQLNEAGFRLWAKLTELVPVGVDASANRKSDSTDVFTIKTVDTIYFLPSKKYLDASLKSVDVKRFLEASRWGASVFIITGLKVARGAGISTYKLKEKKDAGEASASLNALSAPIGIGAVAGRETVSEEATSIESLGDFVLGYQLRKILYKKGKPIKHEAYNVGATFDSDPVERAGKEEDLVVDGVDDGDLGDDLGDDGSWGLLTVDGSDAANGEQIWIRNE